MKPLPAVGLASSIVQIVDFSVKICQKDQKIYQPTEGDSVENHALLQHVADNLFRLSLNLDRNDLKKLASDPKRGKLSEPAEHLLKLSDETKELTTTLVDAVIQAQARGSYGDPKWNTIRDALSTVWKKKEITGTKKKLKNVRKEVDTVLLVALRQYLDQSAETGLPVFSEDTGNQIHHIEKWQNEAMDAIHTNDWKPKNKKNVEEFSKQVDKLIQAENEAVFCKDVFAKLYFTVLDDRVQSIPTAHEGTFEWIFNSSSGESEKSQESNLMEWLGNTSGQNLFWITGKPGAGKSTLMKYLFRNPRIFPSLEAWSGASPGIAAGFFFWNSGSELQSSSTGLLRSLLYESLQDMIYGPLQKDPGIVQWLFADRWEQFVSYGGGTQSFVFPELRRAFDLMISDITKKFLFLIDGLDELDGYPEAVIELLVSSTKRDNVKICTSSRPLAGFQNAFESRPKLTLDAKTNNDIQALVMHLFNKHDGLAQIRTRQPDNKLETNIVNDIVHKASGGFLWASLGTEQVLHGLSDSDDLWSIQKRVESLPADIDPLLNHVFQSLDDNERTQASRLFRLVTAHGYPSLLGLSFANDIDPKSSIAASIGPLKSSDVTKRVEDLSSLARIQCRNFLTVFESSTEPTEDDEEDTQNDPESLKINWSHRCIKDFVQSGPTWEHIRKVTGHDSLNPDECWANASLWTLKTLQPQYTALEGDQFPVWDTLAWCIEYALRLEEKDKKVRVTYLDEVGRAGIRERQDYIKENATDLPDGATAESFMDIAVWLNIAGYVSIKAKSAERKEIRHAIDYCRTVRKRLGTGGEERWIRDRKKIKAMYDTMSPELFQLLEYYAKAVRFATPKPHVDIPEGI